MVNNKKDNAFIEKIAKEIDENKIHIGIENVLELVYDMGVKEGKALVVKNAVEFISR